MKVTDALIEQLAKKIAAALFTDGAGRVAYRLVMEYRDGDLPNTTGWSQAPAAVRIASVLRPDAALMREAAEYISGIAVTGVSNKGVLNDLAARLRAAAGGDET